MVAKRSAEENTSAPEDSAFVNKFKELYAELTKEYAPSFVCKRKGDYFIGTFTGEMNIIPSEYGEVLVLEFEFEEGIGTTVEGEAFPAERGEKIAYWFMGQLQEDAVRRLRPTPGEVVGVYNHGKRENKAKTFSYNDMRVIMPNRKGVSIARKVSWDDIPAPVVESGSEEATESFNPVTGEKN